MTTAITALRGPVLDFHYKSESSTAAEKMILESDALIVLKNNTIIDIGPTKEIRKRIGKDVPVVEYSNCRIIRSVG